MSAHSRLKCLVGKTANYCRCVRWRTVGVSQQAYIVITKQKLVRAESRDIPKIIFARRFLFIGLPHARHLLWWCGDILTH